MLLKAYFPHGFQAADAVKDQSEWPPTPARLFSALTSAFFQTAARAVGAGRAEEMRKALLWLEQHDPVIYAQKPLGHPRQVGEDRFPITYVPTHAFGRDGQLERQARTFPTTHTRANAVYFEYPDNGPWGAIDELVRYVQRLGTSRSMVFLHVTTERPDDPQWFRYVLDDQRHDTVLACTYPGRLADLEHDYKSGRLARRGRSRGYRIVPLFRPQDEQRPVATPWPAFARQFTFELEQPSSIPLAHANLLAYRVRAAMLDRATKTDPDNVPHCLSAKEQSRNYEEQRPHLRFLCHPWVGHPHATGDIQGVSVLIPDGLSPAETNSVLAALQGVSAVQYMDREWSLTPVNGAAKVSLQKGWWAGPAVEWASAVPVYLPKTHHAEEVVREWCEKFRLPPVERVVLSEAPLLFGGERGENMQMRTFNSDGSSRRTGMTLNCYVRFAAPVRGPLCIGQSTNFSMGLMLPVDWHW